MADQSNKNVDALAQEITLKSRGQGKLRRIYFMDGCTHYRCYFRMATYSCS